MMALAADVSCRCLLFTLRYADAADADVDMMPRHYCYAFATC